MIPRYPIPQAARSQGSVVVVAGFKGGVGKSTIARHVAVALWQTDRRVLVVDADLRNSTCLAWAAVGAQSGAQGPAVVVVDPRALRRDVSAHAASYDLVLVDTAAQLSEEAAWAMTVADLVILPTRPDADDVRALRGTLAAFAEVRAARPRLRALVVLNSTDRSVVGREAARAVADLAAGARVGLADAALPASVAFREAAAAGLGVTAYRPDGAAALAARRLAREVEAAALGGAP